MPKTRMLNPDNAKANAKVKISPLKNKKAGAGAFAYAGTKVTSVPPSEARRRAKEAAKYAIPLAAVGGAALFSLVKNTKR